ncbi:hypothetical protein D8674_010403 [Pyrus ussuriensis x Pyrus communis]|uniref:Transposase, Ptta/En/Spm, plant n=1 Tax=Pyrus ussuriensis x Pyrus communis TaxID=2448454 RepID=A0A5N5FFX1_9ROSA|nr:hypothetical protein D8674_010403 [Pyrus ussuriensis x Pyrus communis]
MANMMLDDDAFLASMGTQPHFQFGVVTENESFATNQPHETCSRHTQSSGSTSLSPTTRKRNRGVNKIRWGRGRCEKLNFNRFGQPISPRDNVAKFGRYIAMLARDGGIIPIDSPDWRQIESSKLDRVWSLVQATIDWTNPKAAGKEDKVRAIVETKLHDRFRTWRAKLRKLYYVPFENSEQRKHCNDSRVIQRQWQSLVAYWDKIENKAEEHDGNEPDRVTFFKMTHTRGPKQLPVDDESARMMLAFENLEVEVRERGDEVTTEVRNKIYAEVLGPEKRNQVRGFGLGVGWADVPGIVTEQRGISREVKYLREAYEAQKEATAAAEEKMTRMMHEANEKAEKMKREQEESIQRLRAEQEENLRLAKVQMAEQLKAMLAHVGINIGSFGVSALQSTSTQQQGCGSSHAQISTGFEGGNDKNVQCGPPISSAMMHEDCQSQNTG